MSRLQEARVEDIIDRIYEAAGRSDLWPEVLEALNRSVGGLGSALTPGPTSSFRAVYTADLEGVFATARQGGWIEKNLRVERGVTLFRPDHVVTESMLFTPWELDHLPFNAEFINRVGIRWFIGFRIVGHGTSGLFLSIERPPHWEMFSPREIEIMCRIAPHARRAGMLGQHLAVARAEGRLEGLAALDCPGFLVSDSGRVIAQNELTNRVLGDGLVVRQGFLSALHGPSNDALHQLIRGALCSRYGDLPVSAVAIARQNRRPLVAHAVPIVGQAGDAFHSARAIVMIIDPDEHRTPGAIVLRNAFGLTSAEAEVALMLARGEDVDEIALRRGVSQGTARQQLKSIFTKTSTRRQAELVALVMRLSPALDPNHHAEVP